MQKENFSIIFLMQYTIFYFIASEKVPDVWLNI